jgi:hydrogenase/urease accessory protein HupE
VKALLTIVSALWLLCAGGVQAHELDPGYLQIQPMGAETWRVFWRKPAVSGRPMPITARLPEGCAPQRPEAEPRFDGRAFVTHWIATCPDGISGGEIVIEGLEQTRTDTLIRVTTQDGAASAARVDADDPVFVVPDDMTLSQVFFSYAQLGFDHILEGFDHLLFVFALLVLIRTPGRLIGAITAFTVAHSITLALATFDVITVPGPPVEAVIALSIILLAVEILRARVGQEQLTQRRPWIVSFSFGLLHGLGFAGALSEIGLPEGDVPMALLAFNLGVEAGQIAFVVAVLAFFAAARAAVPRLIALVRDPEAPGTVVMGYGIGILATFWLVERVMAF